MRRSNLHSMGSAIKNYLKEERPASGINLDLKMAELDAVNDWKTIIGVPIANATTSILIKDKVLYVTLNSSIVRNQLFMMRNDIVKAVNSHAGKFIINSVVLK